MLNPSQSKMQYQGNPVRSLWELKGIKWPSETPDPEPLQHESRSQLEPLTREEEEAQLAAALRESSICHKKMKQTKVSETVTAGTISAKESEEDERAQLNDAAAALVNLSELSKI